MWVHKMNLNGILHPLTSYALRIECLPSSYTQPVPESMCPTGGGPTLAPGKYKDE
jgi:hypothetical protein